MENLPTHIITEILVELPINSLIRSKSVCKSWLSLISSSEFLTFYLCRNNSISSTPFIDSYSNRHIRHVVFTEYDDYFNPASLYSIKADDLLESTPKKISLPPNLENSSSKKILASCNDFLLCLFDEDTLVLLNPSTHVYQVIPFYRNLLIKHPTVEIDGTYGVGYDHTSDDYKIVILLHNERCYLCYVIFMYSLRDGQWRTRCYYNGHRRRQDSFTLYDKKVSSYSSACVVHNHLLHYVFHVKFPCSEFEEYKIACYNICSETWNEIPVPELEQGSYMQELGVVNGCLCFFVPNSLRHLQLPGEITLWLMKQYGVKESWVSFSIVSDLYPLDPYYFRIPLVYSSDRGEILILLHGDRESGLTWYNLEHKTTRISRSGGTQLRDHAQIFCISSI